MSEGESRLRRQPFPAPVGCPDRHHVTKSIGTMRRFANLHPCRPPVSTASPVPHLLGSPRLTARIAIVRRGPVKYSRIRWNSSTRLVSPRGVLDFHERHRITSGSWHNQGITKPDSPKSCYIAWSIFGVLGCVANKRRISSCSPSSDLPEAGDNAQHTFRPTICGPGGSHMIASRRKSFREVLR